MDKQEKKELICEVKNSDIPEPSKEKLIFILEKTKSCTGATKYRRRITKGEERCGQGKH